MRNRFTVGIFSALVAILSMGCIYEENTVIKKTGKIVFVELEGGFYGIQADDGSKYDPIGLDKEFHQNGLKVRFEAVEAKGMAGVRMWGTLIELRKIDKL